MNEAKGIRSRLSGFISKATGALSSAPIIVGGITALGAVLRLYGLGARPLWFDEAVLYTIANGGNLSRVIAQNATLNSAPPLFAVMLHFTMAIGDSEWALRLLPWLGGVAALPATYFLARQFTGRTGAYFSTLVVAITSTQIEYSQQLREYSLTLLAATLILALYAQAIRRPTRKNIVLVTSAIMLGISLQYGLVLLVISLNLVFVIQLLLTSTDRRRLLRGWVAAQVVVVCAAVMVYLLSLRQQLAPGFGGSGGGYLEGTYGDGTLHSILHLAVSNTVGILAFALPGSLSFPLLAFVLLLLGLVAAVRNARAPNGYSAVMMLVVPPVVTLAAASVRMYPYGGVRQDMFLLPMVYAFVGLGSAYLLETIGQRWAVLILFLFLILGAAARTISYLGGPGTEDLRPVASALASSFRTGDKIYVYYGAQPAFAYYYRDHPEAQVFGTENRGHPKEYYLEIASQLVSAHRLWLVFSHCYADECNIIPERVSRAHSVELMASGPETYLYLVH